MEIISGMTISGKTVLLDDKHFIDCTLQNCQLNYRGGNVILERTLITHCQHLFQGPARATVLYLKRVGLMDDASGFWDDEAEIIH